jgi:hypothetical protein
MITPIKPWSNHRQILSAVGVVGLVLIVLALCVAFFLQGGFGPGSKTSPPRFPEFFGIALLALPFVYYVVAAQRPWTRKLWLVGVVIHLVLLLFLPSTLVACRGGNIIPLPFLLVGPAIWILYAKLNAFSEAPG